MDSTCSVFGCREHDNEDTEMRNFSINCVIIVHFEQLETWKMSEVFGQDGVHICLAEPHNFAFILCENIYHLLSTVHMGRDSSVGIATRYGLDSPGIESRWRRDFPHPSRPALGLKRPERGVDHPPPPKRRGHERVELYLYSPSGPSWPVIGGIFTFHGTVL